MTSVEQTAEAALTTHGVSIPLRIHSRIAVAKGLQPITVGVPLPKGSAGEPFTAVLTDRRNREIPVQATPLAHWADGSVRWLLLDVLAPTLSPGEDEWTVTLRPDEREPSLSSGIHVQQRGNVTRIDTGAAAFEIDRRNGTVRAIPSGAIGHIVLTDRRGKTCSSRVENVLVETAGPLRATVCMTGRLRRSRGLRFKARLSFFAGSGLVRLRLAVHNPDRARHRGGLWDLGDRGSRFFSELAFVLSLPEAGRIEYRAEPEEAVHSLDAGSLEIHQDSSGGDNWQSRNHVNHEGRVQCRFQGYRVRTAAEAVDSAESNGDPRTGRRASPVAAWIGPSGFVAVSVPEFWQQFPKAIEADARGLRVGLFPRQWDDLFELQGGERKTHTVWLRFGPTGETADQMAEGSTVSSLDWTHRPAVVLPTPEWSAASGAIDHLLPATEDPDRQLAEAMDEAIQGATGFFAKREAIDEYGWRHFGEVWADHENLHYPGPKPVLSHYNNQFDVLDGFVLQMLRTGDPRWFELLDPLARHVMDIDIYHTRRDKAAYSGGLFWHTDHYVDAATSTHRTYSCRNAPSDQPYGGGPASEHNYATGLMHYYYLTGDPDAKQAVAELARWVLRMDDGAKNILGLLDDGPTGMASPRGHEGLAGPSRGGANSINVMLDAWLLFGQQRYLAKAEELIRRCVHPNDDLDAMDLLAAERHWSYTMFLSAVSRYLDIQAEQGRTDDSYAYARACLRHYAAWMTGHERSYLDRREELEYPTETWAAQDFRKAKVLRLAARHADPSAIEAMLAKADEISRRAWKDLASFETRGVARAATLLMREATAEMFLRAKPCDSVPTPTAVEPGDFDSPARFLAQKHRVRRRLCRPSGLAWVLCRLARPAAWRQMASLVRRRCFPATGGEQDDA